MGERGVDVRTKHFALQRACDGLRKNVFFTFLDRHGILLSKPPALHACAFRHHSLPDTYGIQETDRVDHVVSLIQDVSLAVRAWRCHTTSPVHIVLQRDGPACNGDWCVGLTSHICAATRIGRRTALLHNWYGQKHSPTPPQARDRGDSGWWVCLTLKIFIRPVLLKLIQRWFISNLPSCFPFKVK